MEENPPNLSRLFKKEGWNYFETLSTDQNSTLINIDLQGNLYSTNNSGKLFSFNSSGGLNWNVTYESGFNLKSPVISTDGNTIYIIAKDGTLYLGVHDVSLLPGQQNTLIAIKDTGTVSVVEKKIMIKDYSLSQNYPNPFNPATIINFQIPKEDQVSLKVYDMLGNEVATLVNEIKPAGEYQVEFKAGTLASGIYFYSLQAGSFMETKQMMLMK